MQLDFGVWSLMESKVFVARVTSSGDPEILKQFDFQQVSRNPELYSAYTWPPNFLPRKLLDNMKHCARAFRRIKK